VLLRHRQVAAAEPSLDVSDRKLRVDGGAGARQGRVRVAEDQHPVRREVGEAPRDRGAHRVGVGRLQSQPKRLREPELVEEDLRQLAVVVLPGVQDGLVDPGAAQRRGERRRLDELRAVAHNREDAHGVSA
jgi:hypothetical protein